MKSIIFLLILLLSFGLNNSVLGDYDFDALEKDSNEERDKYVAKSGDVLSDVSKKNHLLMKKVEEAEEAAREARRSAELSRPGSLSKVFTSQRTNGWATTYRCGNESFILSYDNTKNWLTEPTYYTFISDAPSCTTSATASYTSEYELARKTCDCIASQ